MVTKQEETMKARFLQVIRSLLDYYGLMNPTASSAQHLFCERRKLFKVHDALVFVNLKGIRGTLKLKRMYRNCFAVAVGKHNMLCSFYMK